MVPCDRTSAWGLWCGGNRISEMLAFLTGTNLGRSNDALLVSTHASTKTRARIPRGTDGERYVIPNLRNACRVLKYLGREKGRHRITDLARALDIPVTSALRILTTLVVEGVVIKEDSYYFLGPGLIQLGTAALARVEIRTQALPVLASLAEATDETAHLAIPVDDRALIVAVHDSPHPLRAASRPGYSADLHCSSTGKVFLAYTPGKPVTSVLSKLRPVRRTAHTLVLTEDIERECARIRTQGFSVDDEEYHDGVRCVAAPVFGADGKVVAAIGITAATVRLPRERLPERAMRVMAAARDLSERIGFAGIFG